MNDLPVITERSGGVSAPRDFYASGVHSGVKAVRKDLALIYSRRPAAGAGIFTTNKVPAAPVLVDRDQLARSSAFRAIVVNSGNANACTGERGLNDAWSMVATTAAALGIAEREVLISSTGVIGQYLPMEKIRPGINEAMAALDAGGHAAAADAILTTDKFRKELAVSVEVCGATITIGGMAKGSGMIAPNMATMLAFVTTDAAISPALLQEAVKTASDRSFNRITVDGDTSTNDMVLALANGAAGNPIIEDDTDPRYATFYAAFEHLLIRLCKLIVVDGEGATKFVEIRVRRAGSEEDAVRVGRAIANSNLVKTAIHGEDANWGRILAAIGYSGISVRPEEVEIHFDEVPILRKGYNIDFSEEAAKRVLSQKEITISINLNDGGAEACFWTCDLSQDYVAINSNYRS